MASQLDGLEFLVGYLYAQWVPVLVDPCLHTKTRCCLCRSDQIDHHVVTDQRPPTPVHGDVRKQSVFDLVPLARARREMAEGDLEGRGRRKSLDFDLPEARAVSITAAGVRTDQQSVRSGIERRAHRAPPPPDALDGEAGRVVVRADVHPPEILANVVYPVGHCLVHVRVGEIVNEYLLRFPLGLPLAASLVVPADQFLLLRVNRDDRPAIAEIPLGQAADVLELCVAIWVLRPFDRLCRSLQRIPELVQQLCESFVAHRVTRLRELLGQVSRAL